MIDEAMIDSRIESIEPDLPTLRQGACPVEISEEK